MEEVEQTEETVETPDNNDVDTKESFEATPIGALFGGEPEDKPVEAPEVDKTEAPSEETKEEPKEEESTEEEPVKATESDTHDDNPVIKERDAFKHAMLDEKRKRQDLEAQLEKLRASQEDREKPEYIDEETQAYFDKQRTEAVNREQQRLIRVSTEFAKIAYKDYDEVIVHFTEAANDDQELLNSVLSADNPAKAAYEKGKELALYKKYGTKNPVVLAQKIREEDSKEIRKQIEAELMGKAELRSKQPTRLSKMANGSGASSSDWKPASVDQVFG